MGQFAELLIDYPIVTLQEAKENLKEPYSAWILTREGFVAGTNLQSVWLWEASQINKLLGENVYSIFAYNLKRIRRYGNGEFFTKKGSVLKRLIPSLGTHLYHIYLDAIKDDSELWNAYEAEAWLSPEEWETKREWQYHLKITPPNMEDSPEPLKFMITVSRLEGDAGFFAIAKPDDNATLSIIDQEYKRIKQIEGVLDYIQYDEKLLHEILVSNDPSTIRIRINEVPLTALYLTTLISILTELHTKSWLIYQGRFSDFIEYTQTGNPRFDEEAQLIITKLIHNSPGLIDFNFGPEKVAKFIVNLFNSVVLLPERREAAKLDMKIKEQEAKAALADREQDRQIKAKKAERENELALLEIESKQLHLEVEKKITSYYLDVIRIEIDKLHTGVDMETKEIFVQSLLITLQKVEKLANLERLTFILPPSADDGGKKEGEN